MTSFDDLNQVILAINDNLQSATSTILQSWFPNGVINGNEFQLGDITGTKGKSFNYNINNHVWNDFANGDSGSVGLFNLYKIHHNLTPLEAAKRLIGEYSIDIKLDEKLTPAPKPKPLKLIPFPSDKSYLKDKENEAIRAIGAADKTWTYCNKDNEVLFYIAKFIIHNKKTGRDEKVLAPYIWDGTKVIKKSKEEGSRGLLKGIKNRPLMNLPMIVRDTASDILVVEGEKCCDAATSILGDTYICTTWHGGVNSWKHTDWSPLYGRNVIIWPDFDDEGVFCAKAIGQHLKEQDDDDSAVVEMLSTEREWGSVPMNGWDIADIEVPNKDHVKDFLEHRVKFLRQMNPVEYSLAKNPHEIENHSISFNINFKEDDLLSLDQIPQQIRDKWKSMKLVLVGVSQVPSPTISNILTVIQKDKFFKNAVWYDELQERPCTDFDFEKNASHLVRGGKQTHLRQAHCVGIKRYFQSKIYLQKVSTENVKEAVLITQETYRKHPVREWMLTLNEQNTKRENIDTFLEDMYIIDEKYACTKELKEYVRVVSRNFVMSLVARIFEPGIKADSVLILEGPSGIGKSEFFQKFLPDHNLFKIQSPDVMRDNKKWVEGLQGKIIILFDEMQGYRASTALTIQSEVTKTHDSHRPVNAGESFELNYPRKCIFVGTTNRYSYLESEAGNRRFCPVRVLGFHNWKDEGWSRLTKRRNGYFLDAMLKIIDLKTKKVKSEFLGGTPLWCQLPPIAIKVQENAAFTDPFQADVSHYIKKLIKEPDNPKWTTKTDIFSYMNGGVGHVGYMKGEFIRHNLVHKDKKNSIRIGQCLNNLGFVATEMKRKGENGHRDIVWEQTRESENEENEENED